jgi:hypothetical protein
MEIGDFFFLKEPEEYLRYFLFILFGGEEWEVFKVVSKSIFEHGEVEI